MPSGGYTRNEVLWLRQMDRWAAIYRDAFPLSQLANVNSGGSSAEDGLPVIARWWDVERAFRAVVQDKHVRAIVELRLAGFAEEEIAKLVDMSRSTVRRRFRAATRDLLAYLGEAEEDVRDSRPPSCLTCGKRPRVRLAAVHAERWTHVGQRVAPDGKLSQAWLDGHHDLQLFRRRLARARIGAVYEVTVTLGLILASAVELPAEGFSEDDMRVRRWARDSQQAERGLRVAAIPEGGKGGYRVVREERQSSVCEACLAPEFKPRVMRTIRSSQRRVTVERLSAAGSRG